MVRWRVLLNNAITRARNLTNCCHLKAESYLCDRCNGGDGQAEEQSDGVARDSAQPFTDDEDELLIAEAVVYECHCRNLAVSFRLRFWEAVRQRFAERGFAPRGPEQLQREIASPYLKRWKHIRTSYTKVKALVLRRGAAMPQVQQDIDDLVKRAQSEHRAKHSMYGLNLGFKHFTRIFCATDGWADESNFDGAVDSPRLRQSPSMLRPQSTESQDAETVRPSVEGSEDGGDDHVLGELDSDLSEDLPSTRPDQGIDTASSSRRSANHAVNALARSSGKRKSTSDCLEPLARQTHQSQGDGMTSTSDLPVTERNETHSMIVDSLFYMVEVYCRLSTEVRHTVDEDIKQNLTTVRRYLAAELVEAVQARKKSKTSKNTRA